MRRSEDQSLIGVPNIKRKRFSLFVWRTSFLHELVDTRMDWSRPLSFFTPPSNFSSDVTHGITVGKKVKEKKVSITRFRVERTLDGKGIVDDTRSTTRTMNSKSKD